MKWGESMCHPHVARRKSLWTICCLIHVFSSFPSRLPAGVANIITGAGNVGGLLSNHPDVDKITFTGSVPTGVKVMTAGMQN